MTTRFVIEIVPIHKKYEHLRKPEHFEEGRLVIDNNKKISAHR